MYTRTELRERAKERAKQLDAVRYATVQELAARWSVDDDTVRAIPRDQLPYLVLGQSRMRRYNPKDVEAFEARAADEQPAPVPAGAVG